MVAMQSMEEQVSGDGEQGTEYVMKLCPSINHLHPVLPSEEAVGSLVPAKLQPLETREAAQWGIKSPRAPVSQQDYVE